MDTSKVVDYWKLAWLANEREEIEMLIYLTGIHWRYALNNEDNSKVLFRWSWDILEIDDEEWDSLPDSSILLINKN